MSLRLSEGEGIFVAVAHRSFRFVRVCAYLFVFCSAYLSSHSVLVWNLHMAKRPEYAFNCQSGIHTALFHPAHPKLIVGGCENGQLVSCALREAEGFGAPACVSG